MKVDDDSLPVPFYLKTSPDMPWPADEPIFHLLAGDNLYLCRNTPLFRSSTPARRPPSGLATHHAFCRLHYPKVPRRQLELVVGFFWRIAELHGSEAAILLAWEASRQRMHLVCPLQTATVWRSKTSGYIFPIGLHYEMDTQIPRDWTIIGDIHSHVDERAYASATDRDDERHRPGLHVVVGHISSEPPDFHADFVVDGTRFRVEPSLVLGGYRQRRPGVPREWIDSVRVELDPPPAQNAVYVDPDGPLGRGGH